MIPHTHDTIDQGDYWNTHQSSAHATNNSWWDSGATIETPLSTFSVPPPPPTLPTLQAPTFTQPVSTDSLKPEIEKPLDSNTFSDIVP